MLVFLASQTIRVQIAGFNVVAFHLFDDLVGPVDLLVFDIKHRIDEVLVLEEAKAVLPPEACEDGTVAKRGLSVKIEFGSPPGGGAIFKLKPESVEVIAAALCSKVRKIFNPKIARLFEVMIIGHDVGTLLRPRGVGDQKHEEQKSAGFRYCS